MKKLVFAIIVPIILITACKKDKEPDNKQYNVIFITLAKGERTYIGTVKGLSSCRYVASRYHSTNKPSGEWDYVCCLRTRDSECAKEMKYKEEEKG